MPRSEEVFTPITFKITLISKRSTMELLCLEQINCFKQLELYLPKGAYSQAALISFDS